MRNFNSSSRPERLGEPEKISGSTPILLNRCTQFYSYPISRTGWRASIAEYYYRQQEADARTSILSQVLTPEAADRLGRIRLVKESRATDVENRLIMLARSGQLKSKIKEEQLKEMLGAMTENAEQGGGGSGGRIVITRRKDWDEDDLLDL